MVCLYSFIHRILLILKKYKIKLDKYVKVCYTISVRYVMYNTSINAGLMMLRLFILFSIYVISK